MTDATSTLLNILSEIEHRAGQIRRRVDSFQPPTQKSAEICLEAHLLVDAAEYLSMAASDLRRETERKARGA